MSSHKAPSDAEIAWLREVKEFVEESEKELEKRVKDSAQAKDSTLNEEKDRTLSKQEACEWMAKNAVSNFKVLAYMKVLQKAASNYNDGPKKDEAMKLAQEIKMAYERFDRQAVQIVKKRAAF
jgi:hypothetical protein